MSNASAIVAKSQYCSRGSGDRAWFPNPKIRVANAPKRWEIQRFTRSAWVIARWRREALEQEWGNLSRD